MSQDKTDTYFETKVKELGAIKVTFANDPGAPADKPIWFETRNFGWILSAKDDRGKRKILVQY